MAGAGSTGKASKGGDRPLLTQYRAMRGIGIVTTGEIGRAHV